MGSEYKLVATFYDTRGVDSINMRLGADRRRKPTKNWIDTTCLLCKVSFKVMPFRLKNGHKLFCSRKCLSISNGNKVGENAKGENNNSWKGGLSKNNYRYKLIDKSRYPEKHKAREAVKRAKKSGKLIAKPCFICGDEKVHAHHEDYLKPLDVKWMCAECHHAEHH